MGEPGTTFGRVAEAYDRTRPGYPSTAVDRAVDALALQPGSVVLDLAAGTGVLTRLLRARFECVIAVEPDPEMRAFIDGDARDGTAEAIPVEDDSVAAVFVGEAFHWFDTAHALDEIARVLTPRGGLAVLANAWGEKLEPGLLPPPFAADLDDIWSRFHASDASFADWRDSVTDPFEPLRHEEFDWTTRISGRDLVDLQLTASTPASIASGERQAIAERAYGLVASEYALRVNTHLDWTRLR